MSELTAGIIKSGVEIDKIVGTYGNNRYGLIATMCQTAGPNNVCVLTFRWGSDQEINEAWINGRENSIVYNIDPGEYKCVLIPYTRVSGTGVTLNGTVISSSKLVNYGLVTVTDSLTINFSTVSATLYMYKTY